MGLGISKRVGLEELVCFVVNFELVFESSRGISLIGVKFQVFELIQFDLYILVQFFEYFIL